MNILVRLRLKIKHKRLTHIGNHRIISKNPSLIVGIIYSQRRILGNYKVRNAAIVAVIIKKICLIRSSIRL